MFMPELTPYPFEHLVRRMFHEFRREQKIFDLPATKFWRGMRDPAMSAGVRLHGRAAGTALGPAAGPHTQMAQNIVLSWLGGSRIIELKTIQVNDRLTIPRPCIDMTNVGYNVEFSQELRLQQSLEEYVKAWMLIRMLEEEELLGPAKRISETPADAHPHFYDCIFDLSVGYNLEGIQSETVQAVIRGLMDASATIDHFREQIPDEFAHLRRISYEPHIVSTATLSTFHGCPPDEIERIVDYLMREDGLHAVIKMNPTMLGEERLHELLHDVMGYTDLVVNPAALTSGLQFDQSLPIVSRLRATAHSLGLELGCKFTNTLEVINHREFFPQSEKIMYMSGAPLHPIAFELALKFREAYRQHCASTGADDGRIPISFSAGVDKHNFADCVASGFAPVTTCTDLLKPGGFGRQIEYLLVLENEMHRVGARTVDEFIQLSAAGDPDGAIANHRRIAPRVVAPDSRYVKSRNSVAPKRINSHLAIFDCITCDKCIPVCPNDANFTYETPECAISYRDFTISNGAIEFGEPAELKLKKSRQIANYSAFCNECGNCDTFCPEYGGPFIEKPTFFPDFEQWKAFHAFDGFFIRTSEDCEEIFARIKGAEYSLRRPLDGSGECTACDWFRCPAGEVVMDRSTVTPSKVASENSGGGFVDVCIYLTLRILLEGVLHARSINYVNTAAGYPVAS